MATSSGKSAGSLKERLLREPQGFSFFQATRLLTQWYGRQVRRQGGEARHRPPVWFRASHALGFPPSEVVGLERTDAAPRHMNGGAPLALTVAFMGLAGHDGPLPDHYTELLLVRQAKRDYALASFLGIFNHRLLELFYQTWESSRFYLAYELEREDPLARMLFSLIGMGTPRLRRASRFPVEALLQFSGELGKRPVSQATALRVLRRYFGSLDFSLEQLVGCWVPLEPESLCRLGVATPGSELGVCAVLGDHVWDVQGQLQLTLRGLTQTEFLAFSPGGEKAEELHSLLQVLVGGELQVAVALEMARETAGGCRLGGAGPGVAQLGIAAWLGSEPTGVLLHA